MYLIDSANLKTIRNSLEFYAFDGVTTNPSLMAKERRTDYLHHLKDIQAEIGTKKLYIQVNAEDAVTMNEEINIIKQTLHPPIAFKIPVTKEGYKCMQMQPTTTDFAATAVVGYHQALMAINAGVNTVIIYVNRMLTSGHQPYELIKNLRKFIDDNQYDVTILCASFKSPEEITKALISGAHKVSINPKLIETLFLKPLSETSVKAFSKDFIDRYKKSSIK